MSLYADDVVVERETRGLIDRGIRVLQVFRMGATEREHVAGLLRLADFPLGASVLDAGCGVGEVARLMRELRSDLRFSLLNISRAQLAMCPEGMPRIVGSLDDMPIEDVSFDAVMICYALGHVDLRSALAEAERVLRPGGALFIYDLTTEDGRVLADALGYSAWRRSEILTHALTLGFSHRVMELPPVSAEHFVPLMGAEAFARAFADVSPAAFRWVKG